MGAAASVLGPRAFPSLRVEWELPVSAVDVSPHGDAQAAAGGMSGSSWRLEHGASAVFATFDGRATGHAANRLPVMVVQHGLQFLAISPLNGECIMRIHIGIARK